MKEFARVIFESVGTHTDPKPHRAQFREFFEIYMKVCEKKDNLAEFCKRFEKIFKSCDEVHCKVEFDSVDNFYMFHAIGDITLDSDIQEAFYDFKFPNLLYDLSSNCDLLIFTPQSLEKIKQQMFTAKEEEIYQTVEHYERDLLGSTISYQSGRKSNKI